MADNLTPDPAEASSIDETAPQAIARPEPDPSAPRIPIPQCPACGYLLVGLPDAGQCPECGQPYNAQTARPILPKQPFLGYAYLLLPPAILLFFELFMYFTLDLFGLITISCVFFLMLLWAIPVSDAVAAWHCGRTHWKSLANPPSRPLEKRIKWMQRWLYLSLVLASMATFLLFHWILSLLE